MNRDNFLFAIIGILLGFIVGFMLHGVMSQRDAERTAAAPTRQQQLPPDHPPVGTDGSTDTSANSQQSMEQVQQTIAKARSNPKDFEAQVAAAGLEYQIGQFDQAIEFLLTANQLKPDNYDVLVSLGTANMDAQHWDAAEKWLKAAQAKNAKDVQVAASLAFVSLQKGDVKNAERNVANFEKLAPDSSDLATFRKKLADLKSGQSK